MLFLVILRLPFKGVGGVESSLISVVIDGHEAGVSQKNIVSAGGIGAFTSLLVAEPNWVVVRISSIHCISEVVLCWRVFIVISKVLWRCGGGGGQGGQKQQDLENQPRH